MIGGSVDDDGRRRHHAEFDSRPRRHSAAVLPVEVTVDDQFLTERPAAATLVGDRSNETAEEYMLAHRQFI